MKIDNNINLAEIIGIIFVILMVLIVLGLTFKPYSNNSSSMLNGNLDNIDSDKISSSLVCDGVEEHLKETCIIKNEVCDSDECFYKQARLEKDVDICFNIADNSTRAACSLSIKHDTIFQYAVLKDNIEICNDFEQESKKLECRDNFYFVSSVNKQDTSYCLNISQEDIKNECLN